MEWRASSGDISRSTASSASLVSAPASTKKTLETRSSSRARCAPAPRWCCRSSARPDRRRSASISARCAASAASKAGRKCSGVIAANGGRPKARSSRRAADCRDVRAGHGALSSAYLMRLLAQADTSDESPGLIRHADFGIDCAPSLRTPPAWPHGPAAASSGSTSRPCCQRRDPDRRRGVRRRLRRLAGRSQPVRSRRATAPTSSTVLFLLCGVAIMVQFVRNAHRIEPFTARASAATRRADVVLEKR